MSHPSTKERFNEDLDLIVVQDLPQYRGKGPLAGILTVMKSSNADWYIVLPCDTPNVTKQLITQLMQYTVDDNIDAIIPDIDGRKQPLIAIYHSRVEKKIEALLKNQLYKMSFLYESCHVKFVSKEELQLTGIEFDNINHRSEYEKL
ncbi:molybdenum cofactor guanylyltransferase [Campylobacter jejuni]|uniref:molybdenum cofactor guanylyltransferase n=1 Tax=Campylobacter jejuni TaxID=197 RepID=UPI0020A44366|nr:molybdenum cofactor guanylyltransferase [Campylobacter jejuni]